MEWHLLFLCWWEVGTVFDAFNSLSASCSCLLWGGYSKEPEVDIINFVDKEFLGWVNFSNSFWFKQYFENWWLMWFEGLLCWYHGKIGYFLERNIYFWRGIFIFNCEGQFSTVSDWAISKFEQIFFQFNLRTHGICLELKNHGIISLWWQHNTVLIYILWFKLVAVLFMVDGSFLIERSEWIWACVDFISVVNFCFADKFDL